MHFTEEFRIALSRADFPHSGYTVTQIVLLVGEVILFRFVAHLLQRLAFLFDPSTLTVDVIPF